MLIYKHTNRISFSEVKVMRIKKYKSVYQLTFMPSLFPVNCYLVEEEGELTLIDAAISGCEKKIINAAKNIGKPITKILLTHPHSDHIGALSALKELIPEAVVYISERDSAILKGDLKLLENEPNTPIRGGVPKDNKIQADSLLHDGDKVGSLLCISAPGHTPGSMAFFHELSGVLICGDAFQIRGGLAVAGDKRILFPFPAMATWDLSTSIGTAEKLLMYPIKALAVGHGNIMYSPEAAMRSAIERAKNNLNKRRADHESK